MEQEPNNYIGETRAIEIAVIGAEALGEHVSDAAARTIAAQWDAGPRSDLHSFVTTGRIGEYLEDELDATIDATVDEDDRQALAYLSAYAMAREDKGTVDNWSQLWIDKGPDEGTDSCAACGEHFSDPHATECPLNPDREDE
jgi:hypothetical protein